MLTDVDLTKLRTDSANDHRTVAVVIASVMPSDRYLVEDDPDGDTRSLARRQKFVTRGRLQTNTVAVLEKPL